MTAYGFRIRRLSLGMTIQQLSRESGLSPHIIRCCEEGDLSHVSLHRVIGLASALDISLSDGGSLQQLSCRRRPRPQPPRNVLEQYMAYWDLTLEGMAIILGVSLQTVSNQCRKVTPDRKYICRLAEEEGMGEQDFLTMYGALDCA